MRRDPAKADNLLKRGFRATRAGFATAILFSLFINLLAFVGPLYMLQVYDRVLASRNETTLILITLIAAFLLIVYASLEKVRSAILVRLGLLFDAKTRGPLFGSALKGSILQPNAPHSQSLRDLDSIREFMTGAGLISFCDVPWVPIFVTGCFLLHPWFGWIALGGSGLIFVFAMANELLTRDHLKNASRNAAVAGSYASATLRNAEVLQAMGMSAGLRNRWLEKQDQVLRWQAVASDRAGHLVAATKFLRAFLQVAILGVGAYLAIKQDVTPGAMIAASIIMGRALAPVEMAVGNWKNFLGARSAYERITALLEAVPDDPERIRLPAPRGGLALQGVIAAAPGSKEPILRNVSFALQPGEILGLVGPSAAGKSTLARVMVGVWPTLSGKVQIDGADHSHWDKDQLGPYIGYLPQDVELFSGTIAENIARFGALDDEAIVAAARMAGVHDMIQSLPQGYNTQIGEGGQALSGGQRQRIGLARALYGNPVLVVLDEPNSSLDADGEAALMNAIQQMRERGATLVLITHKTNILAVVDKVLVMAQGQVQALGNRDEILAKLLGPKLAVNTPASASTVPYAATSR